MSEPSKFYYFGYGSNLLKQRIQLSNKTAKFVGVGQLDSYCLRFGGDSKRWMGGTATILSDPNSTIFGCVWLMDESDSANIDAQEGVGDKIYKRHQVEVTLVENGQKITCRSYQKLSMPDLESPQNPPSIAYKTIIVDGAVENNLPPDYINYLRNLTDNGVPIDQVPLYNCIKNPEGRTQAEVENLNFTTQ